MDARASAFALATGRIAKTDLAETGCTGSRSPASGLCSNSSCSPLSDPSSPSADIRFVKTLVSTKVRSSGISTTVKYTT